VCQLCQLCSCRSTHQTATCVLYMEEVRELFSGSVVRRGGFPCKWMRSAPAPGRLSQHPVREEECPDDYKYTVYSQFPSFVSPDSNSLSYRTAFSADRQAESRFPGGP